MKYFLVIFLNIFSAHILCAQQELNPAKSHVEFKASEFSNNRYYLAGYYGKYTVLLDSVKATADGRVVFKKDKKYTDGIYLLVDSNKSIVTEFIMDENQHFSMNINLKNSFKNTVSNSKTNQDFLQFNRFLKNRFSKLDTLNSSLANQKTKNDSVFINNKMATIQKEISNYKNDYINKNPENVISLLFKLSRSLDSYFETVNSSVLLKNKIDSLNYLKNNFFKGIDFSDERLLRNPFLEKKITTYFTSLVNQTPEDITSEVFKILESTGSKENDMFSYVSFYFLNTYSAPKIMGLDRVFVNVYQKYFNNITYSWLKEPQRLSIRDIYIDVKDNLIGNRAPNLFLKTMLDKRIDLYDMNAPYIVLVFWDPSCGHCKTELPKINKIYTQSWKKKNIKILAVNINVDLKDQWKQFIDKEELNDWIHTYPSDVVTGNYTREDVDFQTLYNVHQTPVLYLLDENKNFIAKKVSFEQYLDIIKNVEQKLSE
jgi:thiol-disulfide isomerase/thioredoxin